LPVSGLLLCDALLVLLELLLVRHPAGRSSPATGVLGVRRDRDGQYGQDQEASRGFHRPAPGIQGDRFKKHDGRLEAESRVSSKTWTLRIACAVF
jgi:hypothetical protein